MKLGKRFTRLKRIINAGSIDCAFTRREDGLVLKPHRKLNMLLILHLTHMRVNKKAVNKELNKMLGRYGIKEK